MFRPTHHYIFRPSFYIQLDKENHRVRVQDPYNQKISKWLPLQFFSDSCKSAPYFVYGHQVYSIFSFETIIYHAQE